MRQLKYCWLLVVLISTKNTIAQNVQLKDLIGTWHVYKQELKGQTILDIANPGLIDQSVMKQLKTRNPAYTPADSIKAISRSHQYADGVKKVYNKYDNDGKMESIGPDGKPYNATYRLNDTTGELLVHREGTDKPEIHHIKITNVILEDHIMALPDMVFYWKK